MDLAQQASLSIDFPGKDVKVVTISFSKGFTNPGVEPVSAAWQADPFL